MTADPLVLSAEVERATARLLATAQALDDAAVAAPSLLPGWTRGHVLTHLARNADGLVNLLTWARTGVVTPQYESLERRAADIREGAGRSHAEQLADLREASARFATAAEEMPPDAWTVTLDLPGGPQPAARITWRRLREVEVHHVDLAAGYAPADWPDAFSHRLLHEVVASLRDRPDAPPLVLHPDGLGHELRIGAAPDTVVMAIPTAVPATVVPTTIVSPVAAPTVAGPAHALAGWLTGRTDGTGLTVTPPGPLPVPPQWM